MGITVLSWLTSLAIHCPKVILERAKRGVAIEIRFLACSPSWTTGVSIAV